MLALLLTLALGDQPVAAPTANPGFAVAEVEWKHRSQAHLIVDEVLWRCSGNICTGAVGNTPAVAARACRVVAEQAGSVTRFVLPSGDLGGQALAQCNRRRDVARTTPR